MFVVFLLYACNLVSPLSCPVNVLVQCSSACKSERDGIVEPPDTRTGQRVMTNLGVW